MAEVKRPVLEHFMKMGIIKRGDDPSLIIRRIPIGIPTIDEALGGGLGVQKNYLIVGPESTGKTILCQTFAKAVQDNAIEVLGKKKGDPAVKYDQIVYIDLEGSFDRDWWAISGVDLARLHHVSPVTASDTINVLLAMMLEMPVGMVILDSTAALLPDAEMESGAEGQRMGLLGKHVAFLYRNLPAANLHTVFVAVNHVRSPLNGQFEEYYPGGVEQRYLSHVTLRTRRQSYIKDPATQTAIGFTMEVLFKKNKLGGMDMGGAIELPFYYKTQIDVAIALIDFAKEKGIIRTSSAWHYLPAAEGQEPQKFLGIAAMREWLTTTPGAMEWLRNEIAL